MSLRLWFLVFILAALGLPCSLQCSLVLALGLIPAACELLLLWCTGSSVTGCRLSCPLTSGLLVPGPGIKPASPALEGRFLTTGPPGLGLECCCCSVTQSCLTLCNPMDYSMPGFLYPPLSPGVCSNLCPLNWLCHPTILSSVAPFSSCLQSFPASGSFPVSLLFTSGGQSIGASILPSVLPMNIHS